MKALAEMNPLGVSYLGRLRSAKPRRLAVVEAPADVVIRRAGHADGGQLDRLAQLDSASVPSGPTLVAERDGTLVAALPLAGGRAVADPFVASAPYVRLLQIRAAALGAAA